MGVQELPNGNQYFSFSEELEVFVTQIYDVFTPINGAIMLIITFILIGFVVFWTLRVAQRSMEGTA